MMLCKPLSNLLFSGNLTESGLTWQSQALSFIRQDLTGSGANEGGPDTILYLVACKKPDSGFLVWLAD